MKTYKLNLLFLHVQRWFSKWSVALFLKNLPFTKHQADDNGHELNILVFLYKKYAILFGFVNFLYLQILQLTLFKGPKAETFRIKKPLQKPLQLQKCL
jgi:hypothetical protein